MIKSLLLWIFLTIPLFAQYSSLSGNCEQGGNTVVTSGFNSSTYVQQSFPSCSVAVYIDGTSTLATIYSTASGAPQANPLVADPTGYWQFYGMNGNYSLSFYGAGILLSYVRKASIGGGASGLGFSTNGVLNSSQLGLNLINSAATNGLTLTFTNTTGTTVQLGLSGALTSAGMSPTGVAGSYTAANITVDNAGRITAATNGIGFPGAGIPLSTGSAWGTSYSLTTLTAALNLFTSSLQGLVPASGGGTSNFLRADGTWAVPPGGGSITGCSGGTGISASVTAGVCNIAAVAPVAFANQNSGVNVQNGSYTGCTVTSSGTATVTCTGNPTITAYAATPSQPLTLVANFTSIGSINADGVGAKNAYMGDGVTTPVTTTSGQVYNFQYNSSLNSGAGGWQCVSANCSVGGGSSSPTEFTFLFATAAGYPIWYDSPWAVYSPSGTPYYGVFVGSATTTSYIHLPWSVPHNYNSSTSVVKLYVTFEGSGSGNTLQLNVATGYLPTTGTAFSYNSTQLFPSQATSSNTNYTVVSPALTMTNLSADAPMQFRIAYPVDGGGAVYILRAKVVMTP